MKKDELETLVASLQLQKEELKANLKGANAKISAQTEQLRLHQEAISMQNFYATQIDTLIKMLNRDDEEYHLPRLDSVEVE